MHYIWSIKQCSGGENVLRSSLLVTLEQVAFHAELLFITSAIYFSLEELNEL